MYGINWFLGIRRGFKAIGRVHCEPRVTELQSLLAGRLSDLDTGDQIDTSDVGYLV
ncbi:hypothetical protein NPIL_506791, partial [Nephila pilipes]